MTDFDPVALRSLASRAANSPRGIFPGVGIAAFSGALEAAFRWMDCEQRYLFTAHEIGVPETDARVVLDEDVTERRADGLEVACDGTFRAARDRLYARVFNEGAALIAERLTALLPADMRAAGIRFEWAEEL